MCVLTELANRQGKSIKDLCMEASPTLGAIAFLNYTKYNIVPNWLTEWCNDQLLGAPLRATNMAGQNSLFAHEDDSCQD